jgi:hypothetical protein
MAGIYNLNDLSTRVFHDFSQNERKWTKTIYTNKQLVKLLGSLIDNNHENVFTTINKPGFFSYEHLNKNYPNFSHHTMYDVFKRLELRK